MKLGNKAKTAFVFSGGASLGAIEAGALKAVIEQDISANLVLGTSVGSLNGAMFAFNPTLDGVLKIEEIWKRIKIWNVFTPSPITPVVNLTTFGNYLISPKNLRKLIKENIPYECIEETELPLYVVSTDIISGEEIVYNRGLILEALMSSAAIPAVFPPQLMGGKMIVDGGVINNAPISTAVRLGAKRVVVFPIGIPPTDQEPKNAIEIMIRSLIYLLNRQLATDIQLYKNKVDIIIVPPPDGIDVGPHDFSKSADLINRSYKVAKNWLETSGFKSNVKEFSLPCDVHSTPLNLLEAVVPDEGKKATTRVKENIKHSTEDIKKKLDKTADDIYDGLVETGDKIKEKLFKKKQQDDQ